MNKPIAALIALMILCTDAQAQVWPAEKANAWYKQTGWLAGCNYNPATAINQLEMWQADTFDLATIDKELGWARGLGFNSMRVFLHNIPYDQDAKGFLDRMDKFLAVAEKHKIGIMFVLFDSCWDPFPKAGKQREPKPFVHNSGWVQCPGIEILKDPAKHDQLEAYTKGVITRFKDDKRVHCWDLFNELDNRNTSSYGKVDLANKAEVGVKLAEKAFKWAREVNPSQPITSGVWIGNWADPAKLNPMEKLCLEQSDIITFHNYSKVEDLKKCVDNLKRYNRPILCTEYMARPAGSVFEPHLAYMKEQNVSAYNWGFVAGKTQTNYPWDSWQKQYTAEPPVWFHEILHTDGKPYRDEEVAYIRKVTGVK